MISIKTIIRTSAMIFAEEQAIGSVKAVRRHFIEAVLANNGNEPLTLEVILAKLETDHELTFLVKDIQPILDDEKYFVKVLAEKSVNNKYYLPESRFQNISKRADFSLEESIERYLTTEGSDTSQDDLRSLLYRFLYHILNTNILAFNQLLEKGDQKNVSSVIDRSAFSDEEITQINNFLKWDDEEKDRSLFELVNYCIEYASAFNSINPSDVVTALRNKHLYLDNSLLYRLIGINGEFRKLRARSLLKRCVESGQHLYISSITRKEFFDTIDYHLNQLSNSTPYGNINPSIFKKYSDPGSFYYYYHEWRRDKLSYGFTTLKQHLKNEYDALCKEFNISEDFKQPFNDEEELKTIESYTDGIKHHKWNKHQNLHENDARNIIWIEKSRGQNDHSIKDTKYYFVTTDRRLQEWDLSHSQNQPVTMLPSQWLALLLKYYSQSNNDYKSFVSFLTISKDSVSVSPEDLQIMLAGISEITEEFKMQEDIVSSLLEDANGVDIQNRESVKRYAKDKLEEDYKNRLIEQRQQSANEINDLRKKSEEQNNEIKKTFEALVESLKSDFAKQEQQRKIEKLQEKQASLIKMHKDSQDKNKLINDKADSYLNKLRRISIVSLILYAVIIILLIVCISWDKMEPITFILSFVLAIALEVYNFIKFDSFNPIDVMNKMRNNKYELLCKEYDFNQNEIEDYKKDIDLVSAQLKDLEGVE